MSKRADQIKRAIAKTETRIAALKDDLKHLEIYLEGKKKELTRYYSYTAKNDPSFTEVDFARWVAGQTIDSRIRTITVDTARGKYIYGFVIRVYGQRMVFTRRKYKTYQAALDAAKEYLANIDRNKGEYLQ